MLLVGALCLYQSHVGRRVLQKWPLWARVSELRRACLQQAGTFPHTETVALLPYPRKSSATPQQSEIYVTFSFFSHRFCREVRVKFSDWDSQTV